MAGLFTFKESKMIRMVLLIIRWALLIPAFLLVFISFMLTTNRMAETYSEYIDETGFRNLL